MKRITIALVSLIVLSLPSLARAEDSHKAWWKYLQGEWTWKISPLDADGTVTYRKAAKGDALIGRFKGSDGTISVELSGWRADTKTYVILGFGSGGNSWSIESKDVNGEGFSGTHSGVWQDGQSFKGTITLKKVDQDHITWQSKGKLKDGTEYTMNGDIKRKAK